jgi:hypothetical protein
MTLSTAVLRFSCIFSRAHRHCERSEAIQSAEADWIASSQDLLAMTAALGPGTVNNPPTRRERLSIQNHIADCAGFGDQALSAAVASCPLETTGIVMRGSSKHRGGGTMAVLGRNC